MTYQVVGFGHMMPESVKEFLSKMYPNEIEAFSKHIRSYVQKFHNPSISDSDSFAASLTISTKI